MDEEGIKFSIDARDAIDQAAKLRGEIELLNAKLRLEKELFIEGDSSMQEYNLASKKLTIQLKDKTAALKEVTGTGSGESGTGGFAGLSSNIMKAERAFMALTSPTGAGLARAGPMLDTVAKSLGMTSGVGFAVAGLMLGIDLVLPRLEEFFGYMNPEKLKASADALKALADHAMKMREMKAPAEAQTAQDVTKLVEAEGNLQVWEGIESSLRASNFGLTEQQQGRISLFEKRKAEGLPVATTFIDEIAAIREEQEKAIKAEADRLLTQLPISKEARQTVVKMAVAKPNIFGRGFGEALDFYDNEEAQKASREADEKLEQDDAERQGRKTARFERAKEFNARRKRWEKRQHDEDAGIIADANFEDQEERKKEAEEKHEALQKKHATDKAAREAAHAATPAGRRRAQEEFVEKQIEAIDQNWQARGGRPATEEFKREATRQAIQNIAGNTGESIAQDIWAAVAETNQKIKNDVARHLRGLAEQGAGQGQQLNGMQFYAPTLFGR